MLQRGWGCHVPWCQGSSTTWCSGAPQNRLFPPAARAQPGPGQTSDKAQCLLPALAPRPQAAQRMLSSLELLCPVTNLFGGNVAGWKDSRISTQKTGSVSGPQLASRLGSLNREGPSMPRPPTTYPKLDPHSLCTPPP